MDKDGLVELLSERIAAVEQDIAADCHAAEESGERVDLYDYAVELDVDTAKQILAALKIAARVQAYSAARREPSLEERPY